MEVVKPYESEGSKKKQVSTMFDNIAKYYDFLNHFLSLGIDKRWRQRMIDELEVVKHDLVLDVATGTADVAIETAKRLKVQHIDGIDISNKMLDIGRVKIEKLGFGKIIELKEADSENLPFEDNIFDAVTVSFGVRNFENLEKGLQEMSRVLKPGGKLIVLEFSKPTSFPFKQLFNFYFKNILPLIGRITSKDKRAYAYLYESVQAFPDGEKFRILLDKTGFNKTQCKSLTFGISSIYTGIKS
jgi:demethylmenaquinone methyltransferase / 2-methoxy-6-polyprenyl-1,4-benzoquinol methylase